MDYKAEQRELKERAAAFLEELSRVREAGENAEKFMNIVRKHTTIEELTHNRPTYPTQELSAR